jgi:hypothetical protein
MGGRRHWIIGFAIGAACATFIAIAVFALAAKPGRAEGAGREWMHSRGLHPTLVECSWDRDGNGYALCTFYVPHPDSPGDVMIQIFECADDRRPNEGSTREDDGTICREPRSMRE